MEVLLVYYYVASIQRTENATNTSKNASLSKEIQFNLHRTKRLLVEIAGKSPVIATQDLFVNVNVARRRYRI